MFAITNKGSVLAGFGNFAFEGMSDSDEARAKRLHEDSVIVDMLFHGPTGYRVWSEEMTESIAETLRSSGDRLTAWEFGMEVPERLAIAGRLPEFKEQWDASGLTAGTRDLFWHDTRGMVEALTHTQSLLDSFDWLNKALKAQDFRVAKENGTHVQFLATQKASYFEDDIHRMELAYEMGLRMMLMTYNEDNSLGGGCTSGKNLGVTEFGRAVIDFMNEKGVIVDTAHSSKRTTLETCRYSDAPVLASHCGAAAVFPHQRNKTDEEFEAVAATGGVVGVFAIPVFLSAKAEPTIDDMLDHIDHMVGVVGVDHVGIGLDWPLQLPKWALENVTQPATTTSGLGWRKEHGLNDTQNLIGFDDYRDLPNITRGLVSRGYSDEAIRKILGENFLRVFQQVVG